MQKEKTKLLIGSVRLCLQERLTYGVARSYAEGNIAVEASQIAFMMIDDSYWTC
jgi:hypothetical protein